MNQPQNVQGSGYRVQGTEPPGVFLRFFRWFCNPAYAEDIEGDLREVFDRQVAGGSLLKARVLFSFQVLQLFRPGIIKKFGKNTERRYASGLTQDGLTRDRLTQVELTRDGLTQAELTRE